MSASMVAALACNICRKVQHTRTVADRVAGRTWGTTWLNTVTYLDPTTGEVRDACGSCAEALDFTGVTLLSARDEIRNRFTTGPRAVLFLDDHGRLALRYLDDVPELGIAAGSELLAHVVGQPVGPDPISSHFFTRPNTQERP